MGNKGVVVLGVTGGIAAYKAADLVSRLRKANYEVHVILTKHGREFVTETTFQSLSQNPVYMDMFNIPQWNTEHIALAKRADLFVVAPATANIIGKVSCGIADDLLSTTIMATEAPVIFAPAMNTKMYENKVVQRNINMLKDLGYLFVEPNEGRLACGDVGKGKMAEPVQILEFIERAFEKISQPKILEGKTILVTAGPTREPLDPFRFITNYSSGKMGYSIAEHAKALGADVVLISGPTNLPIPNGVKFISIETAQQMYHAVLEEFDNVDIVIKSAAVSDYKPATFSQKKIKKQTTENLELIRNPDILKELGKLKKKQILVGFAAETNDLETYGKEKIESKNLDMIVINEIGKQDTGFGSDNNQIQIILRNGEIEAHPKLTKSQCASIILQKIMEIQEQAR